MKIEDVINRPKVGLFFVSGHTKDTVAAGRAVVTDPSGNKTDVVVKSVEKVKCMCHEGPIIVVILDRAVEIVAGSTIGAA